jgi:hypothetical protein
LAAQAVFDLTGSTLTITLTNTATTAATSNGDFLTGVFWNVTTPINGTFTDLQLGSGSVIVPSSDTTGNAGLFGYGSSLSAHGDSYGLSSAGLNLAYDTLRTINNVTNTSGQPSPDGPPGGLIPLANGNTSGTNQNQEPEIEDTLVYKITLGPTSTFTLSALDTKSVIFQYGTDLSAEPSFPGTTPVGAGTPAPLPSSAMGSLVLFGLVAGSSMLRKRRFV